MSLREESGKYRLENRGNIEGQVVGDNNTVINHFNSPTTPPSSHQEFLKFQKKIDECNQIIQHDPACVSAYVRRGYAFAELERYQDALEDLDSALQFVPNSSYIYALRGCIFIALEKYQDALEEFDSALQLAPNSSYIYALRGCIFTALERYQDALEEFDSAIQLAPNSGKIGLGEIDLDEIDLDEADLVDEFSVSDIYRFQSQIFARQEKHQQALESLNNAVRHDPNSYEAYLERGAFFFRSKRYTDALEDLNHVIQLNAKCSEGYFLRACSYDRLKKYEEAFADYTQVISREPNTEIAASALNNRATIRTNQSDALKDIDLALKIDPDNSQYKKNKEALLAGTGWRGTDTLSFWMRSFFKGFFGALVDPNTYIEALSMSLKASLWTRKRDD